MHKRLFLLSAACVSLSLAACAANTAPDADDTTPDDTGIQDSLNDEPYIEDETGSGDTVELDISSAESAEPLSQEDVQTIDQATGEKTIRISATDWAFNPSNITVKKGENVKLVITADEGTHGFAVPSLSINQRVEEGQTITVDLPTDQTGTFEAFCSVPCGEGHRDMKASITVTE